MSNITAAQSSIRNAVLTKCWDYLNRHFDNFTEANKIKVSIALLTKDMPQSDGGDSKPETKVVIIRESNGHSSNQGDVSRPVSVIRV